MIKNRQLSKKIILLILCLTIFMVFSPINKAEAVSNTGEPYLGQISLFPYSFAPRGWLKCDGQVMGVSTNTALFSLLGTQFGGNGITTFNLPDLRDASPIHGANYYIATTGIFPPRDEGSYSGILGEIGIFPYNFTPGGWAACDGSLLNINTNQALYSLIGTTFGGDVLTGFGLPDLRKCAPIVGLHYCISVTGLYPQSYGNGEEDDFLGAIDLFPNTRIATGDPSGNCNGQLIDVSNYQALYTLLGTNYGENGQNNFALPDLRGAVPDPHLRYYIQLQGIYPSQT